MQLPFFATLRRHFSTAKLKTNIKELQNINLCEIPPNNIRNFGIIAHIDHGKSTLADRLLELTGCILPKGGSNPGGPVLDALPVEQARGITVKAQTATMLTQHPLNNNPYLLNLIDTPGHADFTHEVVRSLQAMQGAILLVDATTGVQAQTVSHYWRAREAGLTSIIPVLNKIDLPTANVDRTLEQLEVQLGGEILSDYYSTGNILTISAKKGLNISTLIPAIIDNIPPPVSNMDGPVEAVLLDCWFVEYRGLVGLIGMRGGVLKEGDQLKSAISGKVISVDELGILQPDLLRTGYLHAGQVGYIRCGGIKNINEVIIGDTLLNPTANSTTSSVKLPPKLKPIVFAGMFPSNRSEYEDVMAALDKLLLNDSSVQVEKIVSVALGPGWRLGFLGSLHLDVFKQRLEQEHGVSVIVTAPSVQFEMILKDNRDDNVIPITSPEQYPSDKEMGKVKEFREPFVRATIIAPSSTLGAISDLCSESRCVQSHLEYLSPERIKLIVDLPLLEIINDFNDRLLSLSAGYASLDYTPIDSRSVDLVKVGVKLNGDLVDLLSTIQPRQKADRVGRQWVQKLATLLPRQQFAIAIQAVISNKVIARESLAALRKDVIAKCYGGDKSRKMKLLEAQKEGKEKLRSLGKVDIPHHIFLNIMSLNRNNVKE